MRRWWVVGMLLLLATAVACDRGQPPPARPDRLVVGLTRECQSLDPRFALDASSYRIIQNVFRGLVRKDAQMKLVPDLAQKWTVEDDTTWIFKLRPGILFHDGTPLTADDVAYTFESVLDPALGSPKRQNFREIAAIEVPDQHTVVFRTRQPFAPLLVNLTLGIVPRRAAEEAGPDFGRRPVGAGPYRFVNQDAQKEVVLSAFDRHLDGRPPISELVFRAIPDDATRLLELTQGNLDVVQNGVIPERIPEIDKDPRFRVLKARGTNYEYLAFNMDDPILGLHPVRAAIAHAIDVKAMIADLLNGLAVPATGLLPPENWAYTGDVPQYPYDPERARRLLDEAGFPERDDGFRFEVTYKTAYNELAKRKAEMLKVFLARVGIRLVIKTYDWETLFADIIAGDFQMYSLQWVGVSEPDIYYYVFHSDSRSPNGANRGNYVNPALDRLIEAGRTTMDPKKRAPIYAEIQRIVAEDLPYVSLWHPDTVVVLRERLEGFAPNPDGDLSDLWRIHWRK